MIAGEFTIDAISLVHNVYLLKSLNSATFGSGMPESEGVPFRLGDKIVVKKEKQESQSLESALSSGTWAGRLMKHATQESLSVNEKGYTKLVALTRKEAQAFVEKTGKNGIPTCKVDEVWFKLPYIPELFSLGSVGEGRYFQSRGAPVEDINRLCRSLWNLDTMEKFGEICSADCFNINNDRFLIMGGDIEVVNWGNFFFKDYTILGLDPFSPLNRETWLGGSESIDPYNKEMLTLIKGDSIGTETAKKFLIAIENLVVRSYKIVNELSVILRLDKWGPIAIGYNTIEDAHRRGELGIFKPIHATAFHNGFWQGVARIKTYLETKSKSRDLPPGIIMRIQLLGWNLEQGGRIRPRWITSEPPKPKTPWKQGQTPKSQDPRGNQLQMNERKRTP
jgi:hypothetical protein